MALFRSERGIGRGEVAESRLEVPLFALLMFCSSFFLVLQHFYLQNLSITIALTISMLVFGITVVRVDFGVYILIVAMLLSPEITAQTDIAGEKELNIRYDDILIIVIFLGVMVKLAFDGRLALWQPTAINKGIVLYYGICVFSTLLALERNLGAWDRRTAFFVMLKMLEYYLVFFLVGHAIQTLTEARKQLFLFFIVAIIVSAYGIYTIGHEPRVSAPFEKGGTEPNTLGGYLVIVISLCFALATQAPSWSKKIPLLFCAAIAFLPFLYTLSRASYIALIVGITTISLVSKKYTIIILLAIVLACSAFIMPDEVQERVKYTFQSGSGQQIVMGGKELPIEVDKSTHERFLVWRKVRYLLFSVGGIYTFFGGGVSWESVLDSQYARVMLETGLCGFAAFIFMQLLILKHTRESYRWTYDWVGRGLGIGMFATTIALIFHSFGTISFLIVRIMEPYWFLLAMTVMVRNDAIRHHHQRLQKIRQEQKAVNASAPPPVEPNKSPCAADQTY